uniref:Protein kinase domain-containing protein n=1 Tax=Globisporangium ultimum (strain ATCC 200006 / CBS 805.95 / DAOM BR144) TaxID=431595 RepID=K3WZX6_GLOUD
MTQTNSRLATPPIFLTSAPPPAPSSTFSSLASFASSHNSQFSSSSTTGDEDGDYYNRKKPKWWKRMVTMRSGFKRPRDHQQMLIDQELYVRSILESYSSSLSSNRMSSTVNQLGGMNGEPSPHSGGPITTGAGGGLPPPSVRGRGMSTDGLTSEEAMYLAQLETPDPFDLAAEEDHIRLQMQNQRTIGVGDDEDDDEERNRRRIQRRIAKEALRAKEMEKSQHLARTRRKLCLFMLCLGITLSAFIVASVLIARVGVKAFRVSASDGEARNVTSTDTITAVPVPVTPAPVVTLSPDSPLYEMYNGTLPPRNARSGIGLISDSASGDEDGSGGSAAGSASGSGDDADAGTGTTSLTKKVYTYVHCVLMSLSLWMSLVIIGMHITFRSFRTYSLPLVLELSFAQCGYWITSLLRVQFVNESVNNIAYLLFCMAESFFNFGQISFTCAIAFNMYRSVVSYADVLLDSHSAKQRYRSYTVNVMLLSLLGSITLSLVGYRKYDATLVEDNFQPCLYPTCRLILYVYYPLLAFGFSFIFYIRFKRTIGESYPMSATGRLNKIARSYLVLFFICWGSLITLTAMPSPDPSDTDMKIVHYTLQWIFDVLGVGTAVITLTNFHRCRKAFDFGLSLKTIDPNSIEFEDPVNILGEGTFALVLKAKWHQGVMDNSISRTVDVAVKTFKHTQFECLDQMKEEAYLSSKLMHPCVMMTYGCYTNGSNMYIVYEYLGGGTLQDVLDANESLPYETVLRYAHMIAMGMRFLHGLPVPIIHRDLKPLNCIFDADQEMLKVADFGESRLFRKKEVVRHQRPDFYPSADLTLQMTTNIGSACWASE